MGSFESRTARQKMSPAAQGSCTQPDSPTTTWLGVWCEAEQQVSGSS